MTIIYANLQRLVQNIFNDYRNQYNKRVATQS